jgi:hypothetical protein
VQEYLSHQYPFIMDYRILVRTEVCLQVSTWKHFDQSRIVPREDGKFYLH